MVKILHLIQVSRSFTSNASSSPSRWSNPSVLSPSRITLFITRIRWFHVPLTFAATFVALAQLRKYRIKNIQSKPENEVEDLEVYKPSHLEVSMYKMLPLRTLSRLWGWINSINLPTALRTPVLKSYASTFGCNLDEAYIDDLRQYRNLGEFFRRSLKPGVRPIHGSDSDVVSPSDGTILHLGSAKEGFLEQVKGITYTIESFLGPNTWSSGQENDAEAGNSSSDYQKSLLHHNPSGSSASAPTDLYYCTVYLAPGDYHKFHSPTNWTVNFRRHFPGKLYSVRPAFVSWFPNVFSVNERVAYVGNWKYGFFSMAPVGATNVGSMRIYFDDELKTNQTQMSLKSGIYEDKHLGSVQLRKGEPFGEFNLGSTIVLIFEAPKGMKFNIRQGMKIKYGELISLLETECAKSAN